MTLLLPIILLSVDLVALLLWLVVFGRVVRSARQVPRVNEGLTGPLLPDGPPPPLVAIIVPAHNEQRVIEACATALRTQDHARLRVVFVLDRCTDRTAELLRRHAEEDTRITVLENDHCPPEWAGKCHAAWLGAQHALSTDPPPDYLIFTDADTRFDPRLVRAATVSARRRGSDLLSLLPRLTIVHRFERLLQPAASLALIHMYPIERVDDPDHPRPFANGQFMLFRRETYQEIGGHQAVCADLLEDLAFARLIGESGRRVAVLVADDLLEVSMYEGFRPFFRGWTRIYIEACRRKPWRMRKKALRYAVAGAVIPLVQIASVVWAFWELFTGSWVLPSLLLAAVAAGVTAQALALLRAYRLLGVPRRWIAGYPLGAAIVAAALFRGAADLARRRPVRWGGREYVLTPR